MDGTVEEKGVHARLPPVPAKAADELVTIALALPIDATDGRPKSTWTVST
jgi:hypothetical protein